MWPRFEYDRIRSEGRRMERQYSFRDTISYSLVDLLNKLDKQGWYLVGEVEGEIIVKRIRGVAE